MSLDRAALRRAKDRAKRLPADRPRRTVQGGVKAALGMARTSVAQGESSMLYVLLSAVLLVVLAAAWGARRHHAAVAWNRELDRAFATAERRDMPTRPVL